MILNWSLLYNEAIQRRKKLKITQKYLALMAGVSTPTVIRFESGNQDIQISSVMKILFWLGLVEKTEDILKEFWERVIKSD